MGFEWIPWAIAAVSLVVGEYRARSAANRTRRDDDANPWGEVTHHSGDLYLIRNVSTRDVMVTGARKIRHETAAVLEDRVTFPFRVNSGDQLDFLMRERYGLSSTPDIAVEWYFIDDKKTRPRENRRILPAKRS